MASGAVVPKGAAKLPAPQKIRGFVVDAATGKPLPGVVVSLVGETGEKKAWPLGLLVSDSAGFVSFALSGASALGMFRRLWVSPFQDDSSKIECSSVSANGLHFILTVKSSLADTKNLQLGIQSIQEPDATDSAISPYSFCTKVQLQLGGENGDGCENIIPASMPMQERFFSKIIVRAPKQAEPIPWNATIQLNPVRLDQDLVAVTSESDLTSTIRFGEVQEYKQSWYPLGHSLGEIKYSLSLAPGEATEIAVIEWSRQDVLQRTDQVAETEILDHQLRRDRAIDETVAAALDETQFGADLMGGTAGAFQASIPINMVQLTGSADHAIGGSVSYTSGDRNLTGDSQQNLHDRVLQASSLVRSLNSAIIVHASQAEQNYLQTRRVANHNHCHALTIQYYEVLRQYRLRTSFVRRRKAILVPFAPFAFTSDLALRFETLLEKVLLDQSLQPCFAAIVRLNLGDDSIYDGSASSAGSAGTSTGSAGASGGASTTTATTHTHVDGAAESGTDTGVRLNQGDKVYAYQDPNDLKKVKYGNWPGNDVDPSGHPNDSPDSNCIAPSLTPLSLIYKIGSSGAWVQGGGNFSFTAAQAGPLIFGVNDEQGAFGDNGGYWAMVIEVTSTDTSATGGTTGTGTGQASTPAQPGQYRKVDDEVSQKELLDHLNGNLGYYLRSVWMLLDPVERRLRLEAALRGLDGLLYYIDDLPLGVSGNWVVFGYDGPLTGWQEHYEDDPDRPAEDLVALPTRGLFTEAQLGHCNSCETRDVTRMWDWTQMTTEEPPPIQGVQPGPKGQPEPVPQPASFPAPVVQITQPPAAPDPVGLAAAMKVMGTPNIFRDMSGLSQVEQLLNGLASGAITSLGQAQNLAKKAQQQLAGDGSGSGLGGGLKSVAASRIA